MRFRIALVLAGAVLCLCGCASNQQTTAVPAASTAAPPPKNLSPEEKKAYEDAVKQAGPPATGPSKG